ncbi:hypothetical protein, variant 1 [Aphanomyces astaci]|uniref:Hexose transporter 1 n=2 Tax=Aphanomyces astaci TaxID=112090 RepID=W4GZI6_APHAT|nr:hypothetical protein, variant 1 [Aphanomyces astaci]ETV84746.1 hypothetical protein, variant 1 [Aphanomyces astaci]|eukprot:XP_009826438.1 hypothetical protein, variant 1 [Aphanomyces astaci]
MHKATSTPTTNVYVLTCCACIGGFLFGYDTGVISGALVSMQASGNQFLLTPWQSETVVSAAILGAIVGAAAGGFGNDPVGRKPMILLSSALFTIGAIAMGLASTVTALVGGRFVVGIAIGISSMTIPVYIAETSLPEFRGTLVSLNTLMVTFGQFFATVFDGVLSSTPDGWRYMLGAVALPSSIQFVAFLVLPESPRWLYDKGLVTQAHDVLAHLRGQKSDSFELEWATMLQIKSHQSQSSSWQDLRHPAVTRALVLGCGLQVLQQLCGINTVMYYGATIMQMAGFSDPSTAIWLAAVVALSDFAFTFVGIYLVDRLGRRPLTLGSLLGVTVSLLALGGAFYMARLTSMQLRGGDSNDGCGRLTACFDCAASAACGICDAVCVPGTATGPQGYYSCLSYTYQTCPSQSTAVASSMWHVVIVVALFVYLACFASGMGCMPWTINAEIYPLHVRSVAIGAATTANWVSNLLVSYTFLTIVAVLGPHGAFWLYAAIAAMGGMLVFAHLPETKGVLLEDIPRLFLPPDHANYEPLP